jgi:DNA-binding response OmpR family regulator
MIPRILVIEDDKDIREYLKEFLTENNFSVHVEEKGIPGLAYFRKNEPDLVLLDLGLPDIGGESVCLEIERDSPETPVIILTAKDALDDKIKGLNLGADDYVTKPFVSDELLARIKARLRAKMPLASKLQIADLELDPKKIEVRREGKLVTLTPQEFKLLEYLMSNKGMVLTRETILNRIWEYSPDIESRVVDVYVGYLRKKIDNGSKKKLIHSVRGFGYTIRE